MTNSTCPHCGQPVLLAAVENQRNGKWTVVPLEEAFGPEIEGNFAVIDELHEAVDIMGQSLGDFPVGVYISVNSIHNDYRTHSPSHYLEADHEHAS